MTTPEEEIAMRTMAKRVADERQRNGELAAWTVDLESQIAALTEALRNANDTIKGMQAQFLVLHQINSDLNGELFAAKSELNTLKNGGKRYAEFPTTTGA